MTVYLLRHGKTQSNLERRYIGSTDEPLCPEGRRELLALHPPQADAVYCSPMLRCRETAAILYPGQEARIVPGLRETDFGIFERHTYEELKDNAAYQAWLDTSGETPPPGGEGKPQVRSRVLAAFRSLAAERRPEDASIALIVHGGTIMTLLEALEATHQFYAWQVSNGGGFRCRWENGALCDVEKLI